MMELAASNPEEAKAIFAGEYSTLRGELKTLFDNYVNRKSSLSNSNADAAQVDATNSIWIVIAVTVVALSIAVIIALFLGNSISVVLISRPQLLYL